MNSFGSERVIMEEKMRVGGGLLSGAQSSILEEMKLLKELQDHSGLFICSLPPSFLFFFLV